VELLKKKCGSSSDDYEFRRLVSIICEEDASHGHMPDYAISFDGTNVKFTNRKTVKALPSSENTIFPLLDAETYHDARVVAPGYDIHWLEIEWRTFWVDSGKPELKSPDAAFIGFCKLKVVTGNFLSNNLETVRKEYQPARMRERCGAGNLSCTSIHRNSDGGRPPGRADTMKFECQLKIGTLSLSELRQVA
jgi:hypothetical protein